MSDRLDLHRLELARAGYRLIGTGIIVNSAIYLVLVTAVAMLFGFRLVMVLAIAAAGTAYLSYSAQMLLLPQITAGNARALWWTNGIVAATAALGAAAGFLLAVDLLAR